MCTTKRGYRRQRFGKNHQTLIKTEIFFSDPLDKRIIIRYALSQQSTNAATGTKLFPKDIQRAVGRCETVCPEKANSPSSSQLKAFEAVGMNGFPHRYQRGDISYEMSKADSESCQLEWYRGVSASSSMEDGAFLFVCEEFK